MTNVAGFDLSLTAPGFAIDIGPHSLKPQGKGVDRLLWMYDYVKAFATVHEIGVAVIEDYSYGSSYNREVLGELGGVVRLALKHLDVPFMTVAPSAVKKYATGKGNANKDEVLAAAIKRSGLDITNNNAADAWWLYQIGCFRYAPDRAVDLPETHKTILSKLEWPELGDN